MHIKSKSRSKLVAIYDWPDGFDPKLLFECAMKVFPKLAYRVNVARLSITDNDGRERGRWIEKCSDAVGCFTDDVDGDVAVEFYGAASDLSRPLDSCDFYACISFARDTRYFIFTSSDIVVDSASINSFFRMLSENGWSGYGFGCIEKSIENPFYYAVGVTWGYPSSVEQKALASANGKWMSQMVCPREDKAYLNGKIRDVYEINVLNANHLEATLDKGLTLHTEIRDNGLGSLNVMEGGVYVWILKSYELLGARQRLAGLIV